MAAHVAMALPSSASSNSSQSQKEKQPSYWSAENHQAESGNTYLRAEEWLKDVQEFTLPVPHAQVKVTLEMGQAILRYREELKMYACLEDAEQPNRTVDAMENAEFLDRQQERMKAEWPTGKERAGWWSALEALRTQVDEAIRQVDGDDHSRGAFVKFSVRSPKDSAAYLTRYTELLREHVAASSVGPEHEEALSADVAAIKYAAWLAMRCRTGEEALQLFVRSDRIYLDIMQHELFCQGDKSKSFDLAVHVFGFFTGFDPDYEFRAFVSEGVRTSVTAYNPWVFDRSMIDNKDRLLAKIVGLWDQVEPRIRSQNYSLDFAVAPDLSGCWIVEINNFLPPLAGCGLFDWHSEADRQVILKGPFEFRVRTTPVTEADFVRTKIDAETQERITMVMQPASPAVMTFVRNLRRAKAGLEPLPLPTAAPIPETPALEPPPHSDTPGEKCRLM